MQFLSDDWLAALAEAASSLTVDAETSIVVEHTVSAGSTDVVWHMSVGDGRVTVAAGPARQPDVKLSSDVETAAAIAGGRLSAQRACLDGRIHLEGDVPVLRSASAGLEALGDAFAAVRASTTGLD